MDNILHFKFNNRYIYSITLEPNPTYKIGYAERKSVILQVTQKEKTNSALTSF